VSEGERPGERPSEPPGRSGPHPFDLLPAYALGALEAAETRTVAGHVDRCPRCAAEVRRLREAVDRLPLLAGPVQPPQTVRAKLLDRLRRRGSDREGGSHPPQR
jgi:anti-sigma factor RsiW